MLVVEGSVEANLQNCRDVDIAESGLFKGSAVIDNADVRGTFEGNLVVRKRLLIRSSGQVTGTIRYGQIEVELGGQISGDVQASPDSDVIAELPNARAASSRSRRSQDRPARLAGRCRPFFCPWRRRARR